MGIPRKIYFISARITLLSLRISLEFGHNFLRRIGRTPGTTAGWMASIFFHSLTNARLRPTIKVLPQCDYRFSSRVDRSIHCLWSHDHILSSENISKIASLVCQKIVPNLTLWQTMWFKRTTITVPVQQKELGRCLSKIQIHMSRCSKNKRAM